MSHISYSLIQGFPALRKAVTTHVNKYDIFQHIEQVNKFFFTPK